MKKVLLLLGGLIASAQASIYFVYMKRWLDDPTMARGVEMITWQVLTLFWPIVNGIMYVVADALWGAFIQAAADLMPESSLSVEIAGVTISLTLAPADDMIKAYFYFFGVIDGKTFSTYLMDYIVYGLIPEMVPTVADYLDNDFYPIPLALGNAPHDLFCYNYNGFDPTTPTVNQPTYGMDYLWSNTSDLWTQNVQANVEQLFAELDPPVTCTGSSTGDICKTNGKDDPNCKVESDESRRL